MYVKKTLNNQSVLTIREIERVSKQHGTVSLKLLKLRVNVFWNALFMDCSEANYAKERVNNVTCIFTAPNDYTLYIVLI